MVAQTGKIPGLEELEPENCYVYWDLILATYRGIDEVRDVFIYVEEGSEVRIEMVDDGSSDDPDSYKRLGEILVERGSLDLTFLKAMSLEDARAWLMKHKGVGPKTAAIVLLFSLGRPAFPVDTHIYRVTGRIGLRPEKMSLEQAHRHLEALFPPETYYAAHLNIIRLGREVCAARPSVRMTNRSQPLCAMIGWRLVGSPTTAPLARTPDSTGASTPR